MLVEYWIGEMRKGHLYGQLRTRRLVHYVHFVTINENDDERDEDDDREH